VSLFLFITRHFYCYHRHHRGVTLLPIVANQAAASIETETGHSVETVVLDLGSFASIRTCAATIAAKHPALDSLVLNAGVSVDSDT
jgi:NAD(P)-dependent dehydrogenase (short-subunit alcohol dehydrogenase family)